MKVLALGFHPGKLNYGGAQGPHLGLYKILVKMQEEGYDIEPYCLYFKDLQLHDLMKIFDYIIMNTAGVYGDGPGDASYEFIMNLKIPFSFGFLSEREMELYPSIKDYIQNPYLDKITTLSDDSVSAYDIPEDLQSIIGGKFHFSHPWIDPKYLESNINIYSMIDSKEKSIISNSRWASWKHVLELLIIAPELKQAGFNIDVYGHSHDPEKSLLHRSTWPDSWNEKGPYTLDQIPTIMQKQKFIWNPSGMFDKKIIPRLEYSAIEGIWHGAVPILSDDICPEWFEGNAISAPIFGNNQKNFRREILDKMLKFDASKSDKSIAINCYHCLREKFNLQSVFDSISSLINL